MRFVIAFVLLSLGLVGLIVPFLPGFPFLLALLYVIGVIDRSRFVRTLKKFRGRRKSLQRRVVGWILLKTVYKRGP